MKKYISIVLIIVTFGYVDAQDIQFVKAENGLVVREKPNRGATRLGTLDYGTAIEITEHTNLMMDVVDKGEKLTGEWVKIRGIDAYDVIEEGYVFNGFLTQEKLQKRFKSTYNEFTVNIEGITEKELNMERINPEFDAVLIYRLNENETLENKIISVKHHQDFRKIEVYQKHENSIAISDNASHCDLIDWKHYYSSWKPLKTVASNHKFQISEVSTKEASRFIDVNIEELKTEVNETCGESWSAAIEDIKTVNDFPASVTLSKVFLRISMTDIDGLITEKIIIFEVPLNIKSKSDTYAKL